MSVTKDINCNSSNSIHYFKDVVRFSEGTLFVSMELRDLTNLYLLRLKQSR